MNPTCASDSNPVVASATSTPNVRYANRLRTMIIKASDKSRFQRWLLAISGCILATVLSSAFHDASAQEKPKELADAPLVQLGIGDEINFQVFGQAEMTSTLNITDDGTVTIPLAGPVKVSGLSITEAATQMERALKDGDFLLNPHVTLTITQTRSQRVSVLGEVRSPGRYTIDSNTSLFDLLAQAGGMTIDGSDTVYVLRQNSDGTVGRFPISLRSLDGNSPGIPEQRLKGGDSVLVPKAAQFYIIGEIVRPGALKLDQGMTVLQAIAKAGGIGPRGSSRRIDIKRRTEKDKFKTFSADLNDAVQPDDVIEVKESLF